MWVVVVTFADVLQDIRLPVGMWIEALPVQVTKWHFPEMLEGGDVSGLGGAELPPVDIICGGSPCQDYAEEIVIPK